jgi:hypothetical protein
MILNEEAGTMHVIRFKYKWFGGTMADGCITAAENKMAVQHCFEALRAFAKAEGFPAPTMEVCECRRVGAPRKPGRRAQTVA